MPRVRCALALLPLGLAGCVSTDLQQQLGLGGSASQTAAAPAGDLAPDVDRRFELLPKLATETVRSNASLRALPVKGAKPVAKASKGQRVDTLGRMAETDYYLVMLPGGQTGYLHEDFLGTGPIATGTTTKTAPRKAPATAAPAAAAPATPTAVAEPEVGSWFESDPSAWQTQDRDSQRGSDRGGGGSAGAGGGGGRSSGGSGGGGGGGGSGGGGNAGNAGSSL